MSEEISPKDLLTWTPPIVKPVNDREWELVEPFTAYWKENGTIYRVTLPVGYSSDAASVPRICWTLSGILPTGVYFGASLVHDEAYRVRGLMYNSKAVIEQLCADGTWIPVKLAWSRKQCDDMFRMLMLEAAETPSRAETMYLAVRWFGWLAW